MTSPPPPHWLPLTADKWTKCLQEFSGPGSRVGAIISNDHKLSPTSPNIHHQTSAVPVFPGSWGCSKTWSGSHHQDASWGAEAVAGKLQMMMTRPWLCQLYSPQTDWCLRHSIRQQNIHQTQAWEKCRVTPVNRCQAASAPTCVTITIPCLVHRKLSSRVSSLSKLSLHDLRALCISRLNRINY